MKIIRKNWILLLLFCVSVIFHFTFLSYPAVLVADEVHFGGFASSYLTETPYIDIHPPTGKMMIAASTWLFDADISSCTFKEPYQACPPGLLFALRFLPALFGSLLVVVFYLFINTLTKSKNIALIGAFLLTFENAFIVQGRHILIDIFLLFFGILSLWLFLQAVETKENKKQWVLFALAAFSLGVCFSIKWTGIAFMGAFLFLGVLLVSCSRISSKRLIGAGVLTLFTICVTYLGFFWIHFQIIPISKAIDYYFDQPSQDFSFIEKTARINYLMVKSYNAAPEDSFYHSAYYRWPFMHKTIEYWQDASREKGSIVLRGNPVTWYLSSLSIFIFLLAMLFKKIREKLGLSPFLIFFVVFAYFFNLSLFIAVTRTSYLYHYFPSYLFSIVALAILLNLIYGKNKRVFMALLTLVVIGFVVILPYTYGIAFIFRF